MRMPRCPGVAVLACLLTLAGSPAVADAQRVTRVFDGDTISVSGVGVVRLIGVDAPEKTGGYRASEPFGDAATKYMKTLLEGQEVRLEFDGPRTDPYHRTLAYVFLRDGRLANAEIIRAGWAEVYRRFDYTRKPAFLAAERQAQAARRGMWATRRPRHKELALRQEAPRIGCRHRLRDVVAGERERGA